jgi:hypothetical protein
LQIIKKVTNDNGGTLTVGAFNVHTDAGTLVFDAGSGSPTTTYTATALTVDAGTYTLREDNIANYSEGNWSCTGATANPATISGGLVTVPNGGTVVCTIINDDEVVGRGQIAPTATTCEAFAAGTSQTLAEILATKNKGKIQSLAPGVFFYYAEVVKGAGDVTVTQTIPFNPVPLVHYEVQAPDQAIIYTVSGGQCTKAGTLAAAGAGVLSGGASLPAGSYIIGIKYAVDANVGKGIGSFSAGELLATHRFVLNGGASGAQVDTRVKP